MNMAWIGRWICHFATIAVCCGVSGCGLSVPDIKEIWDTDLPADPYTQRLKLPGAAQIEWEIKKRIYCDLRRAVRDVSNVPVTEGPYGTVVKKQQGLIPGDWQAQVSLTLQVDEASSLTPGVAWNQVLPNQTTKFGPGAAGTVKTAKKFRSSVGQNELFDPLQGQYATCDGESDQPWEFRYDLGAGTSVRNWPLSTFAAAGHCPTLGGCEPRCNIADTIRAGDEDAARQIQQHDPSNPA
jgi:hypothetical protein